jgi:hypothetical protein
MTGDVYFLGTLPPTAWAQLEWFCVAGDSSTKTAGDNRKDPEII